MLALLDLDPNIVKPGWTPLLITLALAGVMVLLFISLRRQFRRIDTHFPAPAPRQAGQAVAPVEPTAAERTVEPVEGPGPQA